MYHTKCNHCNDPAQVVVDQADKKSRYEWYSVNVCWGCLDAYYDGQDWEPIPSHHERIGDASRWGVKLYDV